MGIPGAWVAFIGPITAARVAAWSSRRFRVALLSSAAMIAALGCSPWDYFEGSNGLVAEYGAFALDSGDFGSGTGSSYRLGVATDTDSAHRTDIVLHYDRANLGAARFSRVAFMPSVVFGDHPALGAVVYNGLQYCWTSDGDWGAGLMFGAGGALTAGRLQIQLYLALSGWLGEVDDGFEAGGSAELHATLALLFF